MRPASLFSAFIAIKSFDWSRRGRPGWRCSWFTSPARLVRLPRHARRFGAVPDILAVPGRSRWRKRHDDQPEMYIGYAGHRHPASWRGGNHWRVMLPTSFVPEDTCTGNLPSWPTALSAGPHGTWSAVELGENHAGGIDLDLHRRDERPCAADAAPAACSRASACSALLPAASRGSAHYVPGLATTSALALAHAWSRPAFTTPSFRNYYAEHSDALVSAGARASRLPENPAADVDPDRGRFA